MAEKSPPHQPSSRRVFDNYVSPNVRNIRSKLKRTTPMPPLQKPLTQTIYKPRVTITGVTGYLGCLVARLFLRDGGYRVRGTVRNLDNDEKI